MLKWFRRGPSPHQTALAMIGPKSGDRVLFAGPVAPAVAAEVARVTGLNGQATIANIASSARSPFEDAAAEAGALIEFADAPSPHLPGAEASADLVVLAVDTAGPTSDLPPSLLPEAFAVLRPGGRLVVIAGTAKTSLFGRPSEAPAAADPLPAALLEAGGRAARLLGSADGVRYYEAQKPRG